MRLWLATLLLTLAGAPASGGGDVWDTEIFDPPEFVKARGRFHVATDQRVYVAGLIGETTFQNRSGELVALPGGAGCYLGRWYSVEQWVEGEWQLRPRIDDDALCPASFDVPAGVEPGQTVVQDFRTLDAGPLPAILRITYTVGLDCEGVYHSCSRFVRISTRPFLVVAGDLEEAMRRRAERFGTIDVVFHFAGFPANLTPEQWVESLRVASELVADLTPFGVEFIDGTSAAALALRANLEALDFLLEDPRVENLRPWSERLRIVEGPPHAHRRTRAGAAETARPPGAPRP